MDTIALINTASGSVPENAQELLASELKQYDVHAEIVTATNENLQELCSDVVSRQADQYIAWGGDGTLACFLNSLRDDQRPLLPLPGGTMNLLCKRVHGEKLSWEDCLRALDRDRNPIRLNAGEAGDRRFYVAAMLGNLAGLAKPRELIRDGAMMSAAKVLVESDILDLDARLNFGDATDTRAHSAAALAVVIPESKKQGLTAASINPDSLLDITGTSLSALVRGWEEADGIDKWLLSEVHVFDTEDAPIQVTFDGELCEMPSGTVFRRAENTPLVLSAQA